MLQEDFKPLPFSFYDLIESTGQRPLDMGFGKSLHGLLLWANVRSSNVACFQSTSLISVTANSATQLRHINVSVEGHILRQCKGSDAHPIFY